MICDDIYNLFNIYIYIYGQIPKRGICFEWKKNCFLVVAILSRYKPFDLTLSLDQARCSLGSSNGPSALQAGNNASRVCPGCSWTNSLVPGVADLFSFFKRSHDRVCYLYRQVPPLSVVVLQSVWRVQPTQPTLSSWFSDIWIGIMFE